MIYLLVYLFIYHKGNDLSGNFFVSLICLFSQKGQSAVQLFLNVQEERFITIALSMDCMCAKPDPLESPILHFLIMSFPFFPSLKVS